LPSNIRCNEKSQVHYCLNESTSFFSSYKCHWFKGVAGRDVGRNALHHCAEQTTNRFEKVSAFPSLKKWTIEKTEGKPFGAMVERIAPYDLTR